MPFWIDGDELLEIYETIWTKIKDLQNIEFKAFVVYNDRYIKTKKERMAIKFILVLTIQMCEKMV